MFMSGPHTPRKPKTSTSHPIVRSPYFKRVLTPAGCTRTLLEDEGSESDRESEEDSAEGSQLRTSHHFSPRKARTLSQKRAPFKLGEPAISGSHNSVECGEQTALETHRSLLRDAAYSGFYDTFMRTFNRLYRAKPILIQEHVADDPWKLLVAVTLLNKTAGVQAVPVFFSLIDEWPTPGALAQACPRAVEGRISHLGLGRSRTARLIKLSQVYLEDPPRPGVLWASRCYLNVRGGENTVPGIIRQRYPPTCISHLPGSGPYALDSYRILCRGKGDWKEVVPSDKELSKYLQWKWAVTEFRQWDPFNGPGEPINLSYMQALLISFSPHLDAVVDRVTVGIL